MPKYFIEQFFLVYCKECKRSPLMRIVTLSILLVCSCWYAFGQSDCEKYFNKGGDEFEEQVFYFSNDVVISKEGGKELATYILFGKNIPGAGIQVVNESSNNKECYWVFTPKLDSPAEETNGLQISILFKDSSVEKCQVQFNSIEKKYFLAINNANISAQNEDAVNNESKLITSLTVKQIKGIRLYLSQGNEDFYLSDEESKQIQYLFRCAEKLKSSMK